jgi:co-chaperonin GroES (HSP10)
MSMEAIGQHVLVRRPDKETKEGSILLPDNFEKTYMYGRVISVGPKVEELTGFVLKPDDFVTYDHFGSREVSLDSKESNLVVLHASQLFCKVHRKQLEAKRCPIP